MGNQGITHNMKRKTTLSAQGNDAGCSARRRYRCPPLRRVAAPCTHLPAATGDTRGRVARHTRGSSERLPYILPGLRKDGVLAGPPAHLLVQEASSGRVVAKIDFSGLFPPPAGTLSYRHPANAVPRVRASGQSGPGRGGDRPQEDHPWQRNHHRDASQTLPRVETH